MFTSRAEYRLLLRHDNADLRLTPVGRRVGLVDDPRWERFEARRARIDRLGAALSATRVAGETLHQILRRPETTWDELVALHPPLADLGHADADTDGAIEQVIIEAKYGGYIMRQGQQVERFRRLEHKSLPLDLDYDAVPQLRAEAREKFRRVRPHSLGQAGRISGVNPADIATLLVYLKRRNPLGPPARAARLPTDESVLPGPEKTWEIP
jgi:tRNA uridine 5-carboxymethylaminomethyl modification enzyme